jgi:hypothetical protein
MRWTSDSLSFEMEISTGEPMPTLRLRWPSSATSRRELSVRLKTRSRTLSRKMMLRLLRVVGGRAGRGGEDEAVAIVISDEFVVGHDLEPHEAGVDLVLDEHVVQGEVMRAGARRAVEHRALGDLVGTAEEFAKVGAGLVGREGREEPETAAVDPDDRHLFADGFARDAEEGAVTADHTAGVHAAKKAAGHREPGGELELHAGCLGHRHQGARQLDGAGLVLVHDEREFADGLHAQLLYAQGRDRENLI